MKRIITAIFSLILALSLVLVAAPNLAVAQPVPVSVPFCEDFEGGSMPANWWTGGLLDAVEVLHYGDNFVPEGFPAPPIKGDYGVLLSSGGPGMGPGGENGDLDGDGDNDWDISILSFMFDLAPEEAPVTLGFQWSFMTSDVPEVDDFFMVTLNETTILSGSVPGVSGSPFPDTPPLDGFYYEVDSPGPTDGSTFDDGATSFQQFSYEIASPGSYTVEFLVADQGDGIEDSGLLIDDVCVGPAPPSACEQVLYAADGAGGNPDCNLYILDPATGAVLDTIGPIGYPVTGMAFGPDGTLYGSTGRNTEGAPCSLITIDPLTGAGTLVGGLELGIENGEGPECQSAADISFGPDGTLYGWMEPYDDDLATINLGTGQATFVGDSWLSTWGSGLACSPGGTLWFAGDGDGSWLRTINPATGLPTDVVIMDGGEEEGYPIGALAFCDNGTLFGSRKLGGGGGGGTTCDLIIINTTTGHITSVGLSITDLDAIVFAPPPPSEPVGGELFPVDKLGIIAPWLALALLLAVGGGLVIMRRRFAR